METVLVTIRGVAPTIMQSDALVNPLGEAAKRMKAINAKKTAKTDDDREEQAAIEYRASLYWDRELGPYWPAANIARCLKDGAKLTRQGTNVDRGLEVVSDVNPLQYDGPRDPKGLLANPDFIDCRSVKIKTSRVMRTRPIFKNWQLSFQLMYDPGIFQDRETVRAIIESAGRYIGLSTYRPRFGRFEIVAFK